MLLILTATASGVRLAVVARKVVPSWAAPAAACGDDDGNPHDAMPTIQDSSPEFWAASAAARGDDDDDPLGTLYRNLAGCVMGVRPEAKR